MKKFIIATAIIGAGFSVSASAQSPAAGALDGLLGVIEGGRVQLVSLGNGLAEGTPLAAPVTVLTNLSTPGLAIISNNILNGDIAVTQILGGQIPPPVFDTLPQFLLAVVDGVLSGEAGFGPLSLSALSDGGNPLNLLTGGIPVIGGVFGGIPVLGPVLSGAQATPLAGLLGGDGGIPVIGGLLGGEGGLALTALDASTLTGLLSGLPLDGLQ